MIELLSITKDGKEMSYNLNYEVTKLSKEDLDKFKLMVLDILVIAENARKEQG